MMLIEKFEELYGNFKLNFYNNIFKGFEDREATLTTTEVFCVESINALEKPTVSELSDFMEVSRQNMSYRVAQLEDKGYVKRTQSQVDKREFYLEVTEKFYDYDEFRNEYIKEVFQRVENEFNEEELELIENLLTKMTNDLMPEIASFKDNLRFKKE